MKKEKNEEVLEDFKDIQSKSKNKDYIIVAILYLLVIVLSIFFVIGLKNQKDTVKDNINDKNNVQDNNPTIPDNTTQDNGDDNNLEPPIQDNENNDLDISADPGEGDNNVEDNTIEPIEPDPSLDIPEPNDNQENIDSGIIDYIR